MPETRQTLAALVERARVVICVGPGGVGKTSTSAAVALEGARAGRRTLVLTIDPARRLANALGMPEIGNRETEVDGRVFSNAGLSVPKGRLSAMMLDIKQTWDEVVTRHQPDPERRNRLLSNRLYAALSTALAGSQEYMAMEKLFEFSTRSHDRLDLIVLDTPPAANAVEFLDAPARMLDTLDNDAARWFFEPYTARARLTQKLFDAGSSLFIRTISRFTGAELLEELAELLEGFQGMFDGFRDRARAVRAILSASDTEFVIVGAAHEGAEYETRAFRARLEERSIRVGAVVLNRATVDPYAGRGRPDAQVLFDAVRSLGGSPDLAARILAVADESARYAGMEREEILALRMERPDIPVVVVPELPRDIHDLWGLDRMRQHLFVAPRDARS